MWDGSSSLVVSSWKHCRLTSHNGQLTFGKLKTNSFTPPVRSLVGGILTSVFVRTPTICRGFQPRNPRRFVGLFLSHLLDVDMRWRNHLKLRHKRLNDLVGSHPFAQENVFPRRIIPIDFSVGVIVHTDH